jgi:hypothetical protein
MKIGVHDTSNQTLGSADAKMGLLLGDTTGNRLVNSSDISQTQAQSGQPVDITNFREDVTVNGTINSSDVSVVQGQSGTAVPPAASLPPPSSVSPTPATSGGGLSKKKTRRNSNAGQSH